MITRSQTAHFALAESYVERIRAILPDGYTVRHNGETEAFSFTIGKDGLYSCVHFYDVSQMEGEVKHVFAYLQECLAAGM